MVLVLIFCCSKQEEKKESQLAGRNKEGGINRL